MKAPEFSPARVGMNDVGFRLSNALASLALALVAQGCCTVRTTVRDNLKTMAIGAAIGEAGDDLDDCKKTLGNLNDLLSNLQMRLYAALYEAKHINGEGCLPEDVANGLIDELNDIIPKALRHCAAVPTTNTCIDGAMNNSIVTSIGTFDQHVTVLLGMARSNKCVPEEPVGMTTGGKRK